MAGRHEPAADLRSARLAEVDRAVDRVADQVAGQQPQTAGRLRAALDDLRTRLRHAHGACHEVDADSWASYVSGLDRGLDELQIELSRTADGTDAARPMEEALFTRVTRLELDGWRLRFDIQRSRSAADRDRARAELHELSAAAGREILEYERAGGASGVRSRASVEVAMERVRNAFPVA